MSVNILYYIVKGNVLFTSVEGCYIKCEKGQKRANKELLTGVANKRGN